MAVVTLFIITFLLFLLVRIMPGNPFPSERMSDEAIAKKRAEMGLDDPMSLDSQNAIRVCVDAMRRLIVWDKKSLHS